jgi:biopolymer transport protein ExbD
VQASLILRVDKLTPFEKTYKIMKACRLAGYQKVQLRVLRSNEG